MEIKIFPRYEFTRSLFNLVPFIGITTETWNLLILELFHDSGLVNSFILFYFRYTKLDSTPLTYAACCSLHSVSCIFAHVPIFICSLLIKPQEPEYGVNLCLRGDLVNSNEYLPI